jgi:hypothetical protein
MADLSDILEIKPEVLVVGTGASGLLKVPEELERHMASGEIKLITRKTPEAYKIFNELSKSKRVIGVFHLTC